MKKLFVSIIPLLTVFTFTGCSTSPKPTFPPPVEIINLGKCDGALCIWKTPKGSTIVVMRGDLVRSYQKEDKTGAGAKVTLGGPRAAMDFQDFFIADEEFLKSLGK